MGTVIDSTYLEDSQYLLSQTPPNHIEQNYYLKEMQDKVDADWRFRPNRKWIEQELEPGTEKYDPIEVVIQTVHGEKGEKISDDWYRLVFRNCLQHNRIGKRYRFSYVFNPFEPDEDKNIWIGLNQTSLTSTSSQVVCRCNGNIGSIYTDEDGKNHIHYEPVIQPSKLTSAMFQFSEVAIDPRGQMVLIAQHNKYTEQYYINQRFVIGYDKVYKINNINRADSLKTFDSKDIGVIRIYLDQDQVGELDDMENRIAYNGIKEDPIHPVKEGEYSLILEEPKNIPEFLTSDGLIFKPKVLLGEEPQSVEVTVNYEIVGRYSSEVSADDFVELTNNEDGSYVIRRLKENLGFSVLVTCIANPNNEELKLQFELKLRDF